MSSVSQSSRVDPEKILAAAFEYQTYGWSVIPIQLGTKFPAASLLPQKLDENDNLVWLDEEKRETLKNTGKPKKTWTPYQFRLPTDDEILTWFDKRSQVNIGIVTGKISGLVVLDIDNEEAFKEAKKRGLNQNTPCTQSKRGLHFYFKHPGYDLSNFVGKLPDMDLRADGGYIIAPPSLHPDGVFYAWRIKPDTHLLADLPEWIIDLAKPQPAPAPTRPQLTVIHGSAKGTAYGLAALASEVQNVLNAGEHLRNKTLNNAALKCGHLVAGGELDRAEVEQALYDAALQIGLTDTESRGTIQSGLQKGLTEPRSNPNPLSKNKVNLQLYNQQRAINEKLPTDTDNDQEIRNTDTGNARRLVRLYGDNIRFVHESGSWLIWDKNRWIEDKRSQLYQFAWNTCADMLREAADLIEAGDTKSGQKLQTWAVASESSSKLRNMIDLASHVPGVRITTGHLDQQPHILNCKNGTLDLLSYELRPHSSDDLLTKIIPTPYEPDAKCPTWERFLYRIMDGNKNLVSFLQRAIGYTLTADVSEQVWFFMYGSGKNGKSTFIETIKELLGDYSMKLPSESLMSKTNSPNFVGNDLAQLPGARLVIASETEEGRRLNEALVKDLTGGDTIKCRFLHHEFFEFNPTLKLWVYGNHQPIIRGADEGIWRRIAKIPFTVQIPPEDRDPQLLTKLKRELPGILAWAVRGCHEWREQGLNLPDEVKAATDEYRAEMDIISAWMDECMVMVKNASTLASKIYESYSTWCKDNGEIPVSQRRLGQALTTRGFTRQKGAGHQGGKILYNGLGIRES